jgi:hypothetical protein
LEQVYAGQADFGAIDHNEAIRELHGQDDMGRPTAFCSDTDAITSDGHDNIAGLGGSRWNIF